jgi:hypothetical protein
VIEVEYESAFSQVSTGGIIALVDSVHWRFCEKMNLMASGEMSLDDDKRDENERVERAGTTTPGGEQETKWLVVSEEAGLAPAQIVAGRLRAEGIPARAWQEGAGQAFGLTVGMLGSGYVEVPEAYLEEAKAILAAEEEVEDDRGWEEEN